LPIDRRLDFDAQGSLIDAGNDAVLCAAALLLAIESQIVRALLISAPDARVTVNGYRPLGIVVLRDRDMITIGSQSLLFAEKMPTNPEPLPARASDLCCARCKEVLRVGELAIRCAACGAWHHSRPESPQDDCFLYDDAKCGRCFRSRDEIHWAPEDLDA
jgi:hypothetical protein